MSSAGRSIARSTSSGMVVGPGIARNSRPARTVIVGFPCSCDRPCCRGRGWDANRQVLGVLRGRARDEKRLEHASIMLYRLVSRQPAASASSTEQNQRVPFATCILIWAYQRLLGV